MKSDNINRGYKSRDLTMKIYASIHFLAQVFCLYKLLTGIAWFYEEKITAISCIELSFGIFYTNAYFRGISGTLIGVAYILIIVVMIINLKKSVIFVKKAFLPNDNSFENTSKYVYLLGTLTGQDYLLAIIFALVCFWVHPYKITLYLYIFVVIWLALFAAGRIIPSVLNEKSNLRENLINAFADFIVVAPLFVIALLIKDAVIADFVHEIKNIFIMPITMLVDIIEPTAYISIIVFSACVIYYANERKILQKKFIRKFNNFILIAIGTLGVGAVVFYIWNDYGTKLDIENLIRLIKPYFPLLCAAISMLVGSYISKHENQNNNVAKNEDYEKIEILSHDQIEITDNGETESEPSKAETEV